MRKYLFLTIAATALLGSCNKMSNEIILDEDITKKEVIRFGVSTPEAEVVTKGDGIIDAWNGETINIVGYEKGSDEPLEEINHIKATARETSINLPKLLYYADRTPYLFYAYYVDDAQFTAPSKIEPFVVTIDGTQDIMAAVADPLNDFQNAKNLENDMKGMTEDNYDNYVYSSISARRGIVPTLSFEHMLTSLNFKVVGETTQESEGVYRKITINSFDIKCSKEGIFSPHEKTIAPLRSGTELKNEDIITIEPEGGVALHDEDGEAIGEQEFGGALLFVSDNQTSYDLTINLTQTAGDTTIDDASTTVNVPIPNNAKYFMAGTKYYITIKVYGMEKITITTDIVAWDEGPSFTVNPDDI